MVGNLNNIDIDENIVTFVHILSPFNGKITSIAIVCLITIVNIIFSGYFKYYLTYDHFFFTVRSPCHTALPDPK